jgi:hypothetical protein
LFLTSAADLLLADATGWIGPDGTKSGQEDGGRKPEEGKFKNRLAEENGPKKTACSNRQDQDISITPQGLNIQQLPEIGQRDDLHPGLLDDLCVGRYGGFENKY